MPSSQDHLATVSPQRRRLGWLAVGCAVVGGTVVILSLFSFSIYHTYSRELHASWIRTMKQEVLGAIPPTERSRVEEGFDALASANEAGRLSLSQIGRLNWIYVEASSKLVRRQVPS